MRGRFIGLALLLGGCAVFEKKPAPVPSPAEAHLVQLMAQRLEIARQVAWIKYQNHSPIRDPKREAELLNSLVAKGSQKGLPPTVVRKFFQAQIAASCRVQWELIHGWRRGALLPAVAPRDLKTQIRPELDRISEEMLAELAKAQPFVPALAAYAKTVLRRDGFSWWVGWLATGQF